MVKKFLQKTKEAIFVDPWALYKKEKHLLDKPFFFEGTNGKAIMLIHGWTCTPYEVRRLGQYLNESGYTVCGPLLRGHGTVPKDLENVQWKEWTQEIEKEYLKLKEKHRKVYLGGTSIGANITLLMAKKYPEISGLVLMAPLYKFKLERAAYWLAKFLIKFQKYRKKIYPPTFGAATTITRLISYQTYPFKSMFEAFALVKKSRENLAEINQPCFLIQSTHDHMVVKNNLELIYGQIGSAVKKKKYIHRAYHTFISDIKNEHIFEEILAFISEK